jgi:hypothetical protein
MSSGQLSPISRSVATARTGWSVLRELIMYSNDMQEEDPWLPVRTVMEVERRPADGEEALRIAMLTGTPVRMRWLLDEVLKVMVHEMLRTICRKAEYLVFPPCQNTLLWNVALPLPIDAWSYPRRTGCSATRLRKPPNSHSGIFIQVHWKCSSHLSRYFDSTFLKTTKSRLCLIAVWEFAFRS